MDEGFRTTSTGTSIDVLRLVALWLSRYSPPAPCVVLRLVTVSSVDPPPVVFLNVWADELRMQ